MTQTLAYEKGKNEVRHRAYGHAKRKDGFGETDQSPTSAVLGDGGIYVSIDDLAKWDRALREHSLLSEAEMRPALTPVEPADGPAKFPDGAKVSYGFGWLLDPYKGHKRMSHGGVSIGFQTTIQRFPDDHLTVIVLANCGDLNSTALALKVADLYLDADEVIEPKRPNPQGGANGRQPLQSETNRAPPAAASRRLL
jgi:CubicO group peptidase (beta-lactamase class C family)